MARKGRKLKCTPELINQIAALVSSGNYIETACQISGISRSTFYDWKKKGEEGKRPFLEFLDTIKKAEAIAEAKRIQLISQASEENWQAAAWYLERRFPERWGRKKVDMEHSGDIQVNIKVEGIKSGD